jgi:threonine dehydrogenase-like Zn-dependent dehydrogenase
MRAVVFQGQNNVTVETVDDPVIKDPTDIIVKVSATAICGSDLHLYDGYIPTTEKGDIFGHEFMGEVVEKGLQVTNLKVGDKVVVPFPISCGYCFFCSNDMYSLCDNTNPNSEMAVKMYGFSPAGIFGYSHMLGGFQGGQAEFVRVPEANIGPLKIENGIPDDKVLFLSDILPTGYMAAENCDIQAGETVAVWGCGPVGLFAIKSALLLGAGRVIAIDRFPERLNMAEVMGAETINYSDVDNVIEFLKDTTYGRGPDCCIDAVGMEAHGEGLMGFFDKAKQAVRLESDRATALRELIQACRKGGKVSIAGVYGGIADKIPLGAMFNKGLTIRQGQTHVHKYMRPLLERIMNNEIEPESIITHRLSLEDGPKGYDIFKKKKDNCIKVVMYPGLKGENYAAR